MLTVHGEGHANQQRKIDWTLLIKPASQLHFKTGMATNYSQRSTRGPAQHHFPLVDDTVLDMALMVLTQSVNSKY